MQVRTVGGMKQELNKYPDAMELLGYNGGDDEGGVPISIYPASPMQTGKMKLVDGTERDVEIEICDGKVTGTPLPLKLTISVSH